MDATHDRERGSWVASADHQDTDFPLQNLPLGVARDGAGETSAVTAIGDMVLDLAAASEAGLLEGLSPGLLRGGGLDRLLAGGPGPITELRHAVFALLERGSPGEETVRRHATMLRPRQDVELVRPTALGSFTDFYAGIHHARGASRALRLSAGLGENYRWVPIAYGSRASSVGVSGGGVRRPSGQRQDGDGTPRFGPTAKLDFELELGFFVGRPTTYGAPVTIADATDHIAGFCLLNDWSARDVQRWEMAPLGPFLSKSFATTISPWIVTSDALAPFRVPAMPRGPDDPAPLPYLDDEADQAHGGLAIALTITLLTARTRERGESGTTIARSDAQHLYWTPAQMLTHHTSNGSSLQTGDLLGTGTVSGPDAGQHGSLLELTDDGRRPLRLAGGEERGYLEDGDEVTFTARCSRDGFASIGFGACVGTVGA